MLALDGTQIAVALIGFGGVLATVVGVQLKVHAENRRDHGQTSDKVDRLLDLGDHLSRDVGHIRTDVTHIHGAINELRKVDNELIEHEHAAERRITRLERQPPTGDIAS